MESEKFDFWCLVELFGHQRIAGKCSEQNVAGTNMLRVDVPETKNNPGFTRFLSSGSIYAINPVSEIVARQLADNLCVSPVNVWDVSKIVENEVLRLGRPKDEGTQSDFEDQLIF